MGKSKVQRHGAGSPVVDWVATIEEKALSRIPGKKDGMELVDSGT